MIRAIPVFRQQLLPVSPLCHEAYSTSSCGHEWCSLSPHRHRGCWSLNSGVVMLEECCIRAEGDPKEPRLTSILFRRRVDQSAATYSLVQVEFPKEASGSRATAHAVLLLGEEQDIEPSTGAHWVFRRSGRVKIHISSGTTLRPNYVHHRCSTTMLTTRRTGTTRLAAMLVVGMLRSVSPVLEIGVIGNHRDGRKWCRVVRAADGGPMVE